MLPTQHSFVKLHPVAHGIFIALSIGAAYWWLQIPELSFYSLQVFGITILLYFFLKRLSNSKIWHLAPAHTSIEMVLATFAFLLLIGSTGNFTSPFYSLTYIHLFLLVFSSGYKTSSISTGLLMLFHYSLSSSPIELIAGNLITLPIIFFFFLFAKSQYEEVVRERNIIAADEATLTDLEGQTLDLETFLNTFVSHKLQQLRALANDPVTNHQALLGQISLIEIEVEQILSKLRMKYRSREKTVLELDTQEADLE